MLVLSVLLIVPPLARAAEKWPDELAQAKAMRRPDDKARYDTAASSAKAREAMELK
jgi:hypothetical protein